MTQELKISYHRNDVVILTLDRPERRNAVSNALLAAIADALAAADADGTVRIAVVTGSATLFAAGADISELTQSSSDTPAMAPRFLDWQRIRTFSKPLIGAVEGWCLGAGLELAMSCDMIIAGNNARFGLPETSLGIMPGGGGTALLPRIVGRALATRMVLTGEPISAGQAVAAGLVAEVVPSGTAIEAALILAETLAARAPLALRAAKASLRDTTLLSLRQHYVSERQRFTDLLASADAIEGITAFKEKRAPRFRGH